MRRLRAGSILIAIGMVVYVIENVYFGWNSEPMSLSELHADNVSKCLLYGGVFMQALPLMDLYVNAVKKLK